MSDNKLSIAFYNLENLFDPINDPHVLDDDFSKEGRLNWDEQKYAKKLYKLSNVITSIGKKETATAPSLVGVAEVENKKVLNDLVATKALQEYGYKYVHFNSPDERGIDTALLYKSSDFKVIETKPYTLHIESEPGIRDFTRDILYVHGELLGVPIYILVNHWPSRREGEDVTQHKRIAAAKKNREIIGSIREHNPEARIVIMGDFNDNPHSVSIRDHLVMKDFYNPMIFLLTRYEGSLNFRSHWYLFDQIILSIPWMKAYKNPLMYLTSDIYNEHYLTEYDGKFKGNPFRTYAGGKYLGGYSDHFPVYTIFKKEKF